jgi:tetratricopeptide (TPR) repeat protein
MRKRIIAAMVAGLLGAAALFGQAKQPKPKSQKEVDALMAIQNAQTPDARIAAIEDLLTKFADTEFKVMALQMAAASAQQKNDFDKMVVYAERTLEADPNNYPAMLMLANGYALRTREFDLDKEEKLAKSESYAKKALELIKTAEKPNPQITDDQWVGAKKDLESQAHEALANAAVVRKKYDVAITEFKQSIDGAANPDPATMVREASAYIDWGKPDAAIAVLDKVQTMPDAVPQVKQAASQLKMKAVTAKNAAAKPAAPATPQQ